MTNEFSVIVMAYNEAPYIREMLEALEDFSFNEVFILDNGSSDGTAEIIADLRSKPMFNVYLRKRQHDLFDNLLFLASEVGSRHVYLLGADDFIRAANPPCSMYKSEHFYSYSLPDTHYFKDGKSIKCKTYPDEHWLSSLLSSKSKCNIVQSQLSYASFDVHCLGLHYGPFLKKIILDLKTNSTEGLPFWIVLCNLLMAYKKGVPLVSRESSFELYKRTENKFRTGTSASGSIFNQPANSVLSKILFYISQFWGSLYNSCYVILVFRLDFLAAVYLLCGARRKGKDGIIFAFGPILNFFYSIKKLIRKLILQSHFENSR